MTLTDEFSDAGYLLMCEVPPDVPIPFELTEEALDTLAEPCYQL